MIDPTAFMREILTMWFERDATIRRETIRAHFHPDVRFVDHDGTFVGYEGLEAFSDSLQRRFPSGAFVMTSAAERLDDAIRAYWTLGPAAGMDFALLEGDKIKTLYAFVTPPK